MSDRYDRQRRLAGVGDAGQRRIEASHARIPAGPSAAVELAYLVRAGVATGRIDGELERGFAHAARFRFSGPRAVAAGAHGALLHLRSALAEPAA